MTIRRYHGRGLRGLRGSGPRNRRDRAEIGFDPSGARIITEQILKEDETTKHIPLIMLTAHAFDEHRERAKQAGADGFLAKPVLPDALAREIRSFLKL